MKEYFGKQIQTYCHLTFKNKIFSSQQQSSIFRTNHIQNQKSKEKNQKLSLKKINSEQFLALKKKLHSPNQSFNKELQSDASPKKKNKNNLDFLEKLPAYKDFQYKEINLSKSLPKDLNKRKEKRNLMQQLKEYKMRKERQNKMKKERQNNLSPSKVYSPNAFKMYESMQRPFVKQLSFKNVSSTPQPQRYTKQSNYYSPNAKLISNSIYSKNSYSFSPFSYFQNKHHSQFEPLSIKKIQSQKFIGLEMPNQASQLHQSLVTKNGNQLMKQVSSNHYYDDMDTQIKIDLINSMKYIKTQKANSKPEESLRSTMISPSQMKYNQNNNVNMNFATNANGFKKLFDDSYEPKNRNFNIQRNKLDEKKVINRKQRFKSIVSVHSQHDSQSQKMKDSVVLETHNNLRVSGRVTKLI